MDREKLKGTYLNLVKVDRISWKYCKKTPCVNCLLDTKKGYWCIANCLCYIKGITKKWIEKN